MVSNGIRPTIRNFWRFYREYTDTAVHTASAAGLAIFGLLVFVDPWFAILAIASYVLPPIVLFGVRGTSSVEATNEDAGTSREYAPEGAPGLDRADVEAGVDNRPRGAEHWIDGTDTDSDSDDGDTDSDSDT